MPEAKITSKGQIVIPKAIRDRLQVEPGDRIVFRVLPDGKILMEPKIDLRKLRGVIDPGGMHLTIEEINETIEKHGQA